MNQKPKPKKRKPVSTRDLWTACRRWYAIAARDNFDEGADMSLMTAIEKHARAVARRRKGK